MNKLKLLAVLMIAMPYMMQASDNESDSDESADAPYVSIFDYKYQIEVKNDDKNTSSSSSSSSKNPKYTVVDAANIFEDEKVRILQSIITDLLHASNSGRTAYTTNSLNQIKLMQKVELNEEKLKNFRNNTSSLQQNNNDSQVSELQSNKRKRSSNL